jgi:hypothetical protein
MLSTTFGMVSSVVARSSVCTEVCDRATAELQERTSPHACLLPWIPMRTSFNFPSLVSSVHGRSADAASRPRAFKSEALLSLKCRLERQRRLAVHRC